MKKPSPARLHRCKHLLQEDAWGVALIVLVVIVSGCLTVATSAAVHVHKDALEELYDRVRVLENRGCE